nr:hypothetical protein [uncultured Pedobacter sp.]
MLKNTIKNWKTNLLKSKIVFTFFVMTICAQGNLFAIDQNLAPKIPFDKNPVLISDSLKTIEPKLQVNSSLDKLSENIYFSSLNQYFFITRIFDNHNWKKADSKFSEILALANFYDGNTERSIEILTDIFNTTTDSIQKAKTCLNLIKINYLTNQTTEAMNFIKLAKADLMSFYSYKQKYELLFTEAKIALTQGLTSKAEDLIIKQLLPMSNKVKGKHNEFNCYLFLGKIYLKSRQLTQAKWFFIQANTIALNQNYIDGEIETSLLLAKTKIKVGDFSVALQDLAKARKLIDHQHQIYLEDLNQLSKLARK